MINFDQFEVTPQPQDQPTPTQPEHPSEPFSNDHLSTPHPTTIHESAIQQIEDIYSSIEHSANILDGVYRCDHPFLQEQPFDDQEKEDSEECKIRKRLQRRLKNQTKNIPKNFGKGIISFIQKNDAKIRDLLTKYGVNYSQFLQKMRVQKKIINTIADLRRLWTDPVIGKSMRVISNIFFRRHALNYIFNSRISNFSSHVKYRQSLWEALRSPENFNRIKQY